MFDSTNTKFWNNLLINIKKETKQKVQASRHTRTLNNFFFEFYEVSSGRILRQLGTNSLNVPKGVII